MAVGGDHIVGKGRDDTGAGGRVDGAFEGDDVSTGDRSRFGGRTRAVAVVVAVGVEIDGPVLLDSHNGRMGGEGGGLFRREHGGKGVERVIAIGDGATGGTDRVGDNGEVGDALVERDQILR